MAQLIRATTAERTVDDVFAACGGPAKFARTFGLKGPSTASEMKRRASISIDLWPGIVAWAQQQGVDWLTYECLTLMHAKPLQAVGA